MQDVSAPASPPANYSYSPASLYATGKPFVHPASTTPSAPCNTDTNSKKKPTAISIVKSEPPTFRPFTEWSTVRLPARCTGTEGTLRTYARKTTAPPECNALRTVQDNLVDSSGLRVKFGKWTDVQEPQVKAEIAQRHVVRVFYAQQSD
ncbi:hypothetical protein KCU92_g9857, partial [Aureobasidium melanogenum]